MLFRGVATVASISVCAGCATVVNDSTHPMRVETVTVSGEEIRGAECKLTNDYGITSCKSGDSTTVRRSSKDMDIVCTYPGMPVATGRAISRANAGMFGNIILGGGIGAIIDHNKGTAYTYPTWVKLAFGKTLIFDRSDEKEGLATPGREGDQAQASSDAAVKASPGSPSASSPQAPQNSLAAGSASAADVAARQTNAPVTSAANRDEAAQLQKLKELRDKGLLSDEEYEKKRKEIIDRL